MDFSLTKQQREWEKKAADFAAAEIHPNVQQLEDDLAKRKALFVRMAKAGFFTLTISQTDTLAYILALKAIAKVDAGIAVAMAVTNMVAEAIALYGTGEQKKKYLPKMGNGKCVPAAFALTEKLTGSDARSIQTKAKKTGDGYLLEGEKQFITNGDIAGVIIVLVRESNGISAFLVDKDIPGLHVAKKERKLGLLTANLVTLQFDKCRLPKSSLLGQSGEGFKIAMSSLDSGRIGIAAQAVGIGEAAFDASLNFSKERVQFGHPICENQAIAFKLTDMRVRLDAGTLLLYHAAWLKDQGKPYTLAASEAKLFCSEICNEIAAEALQIHGGRGYTKDYEVEKYFRDARVTTLYEGTSEIQRLVISKQLIKD